MSSPSRPSRLRVLSAGVLVAAALGATAATAAPITASGPGHVSGKPADLPAARTISRLATTFDPATGAWSSTVTFGAPQSAETAGGLILGLKFADERTTTAGWTARTDPAAPTAVYHEEGLLPGQAGPPTTVAFSPDRTSLTLATTDPALIGRTADHAVASIQDADGNVQLGTAQAILGPKAPRARIPANAARLVATRRGSVVIPLSPLPTAARRVVSIYVPRSTPLTVRSLPASAYRRRSVRVRIPASRLGGFGAEPRAATLVVRTEVPSGSVATVSRKVTLRRR